MPYWFDKPSRTASPQAPVSQQPVTSGGNPLPVRPIRLAPGLRKAGEGGVENRTACHRLPPVTDLTETGLNRSRGMATRNVRLCLHCNKPLLGDKRSYCSEACQVWFKTDIRGPDECWLWTGYTQKGYGAVMVSDEGRQSPRELTVSHGKLFMAERWQKVCWLAIVAMFVFATILITSSRVLSKIIRRI